MTAYRVANIHTEATLQIIASDAPSSYGLTPDFVICDEVVHWRKRDLWDSLISSAAKRATCIVLVITNAGIQDDWSWHTREVIRTSPSWYFSRLDGPVASWIDADLLAEQQRLLPTPAFQRLWLNTWLSGGGDAFAPDVIDSAFDHSLTPLPRGVSVQHYVAGLDLGVSRDCSAVCVLGVHRQHHKHGRIRLAQTRLWRPTSTERVDLQEVEDALMALHARFNFRQVNFDPWQASHMASRLQSAGLGRIASNNSRSSLPMVEVPPTGQNLRQMATATLEAFNDRRVALYEEPNLLRDLHRLRVEERSYGFRLVSPRDEYGHGDMASAFQLALLAASQLALKRTCTAGVLGSTPTSPSPLEQALHEFRTEQERYAAEQTMRFSSDTHME